MKILYVHQYFNTPKDGGSIRSYHLAKGLVENGHEVSMISAHNGPSKTERIDGIIVHYLNVPYNNRFGFLKRIWAFMKFVRLAQRVVDRLCKDSRFDVAYVVTTPLTTGLIALHIKKKHNVPYYFEVGDLWPEAPIKIGAIKNSLLKKRLYDFEKKCYFEAQKVVALSPSIRNYIASTSPETQVNVLPNFSDNDFFQPVRKLHHFSRSNPLKIGYIGTFGVANHLDFLVDVAQLCEQQDIPVEFNLMGDGATFEKTEKAVKKLRNTKVYPFGDKESVKTLLEDQDAIYVSFKNLEILNTGSPNKFFDGLAAGKLIIINFGGWIRNIVEKHDCGFYHDPLAPEEFVRKIKVFLKDTTLISAYQNNARAVAENYYDKNLQVRKLIKILNNEKKLDISDSEVYILTA